MKIGVFLSGGVDSTVTALLLKQEGYDLLGITMVSYDASVAEKGAKAAELLGIDHKVVDLKEEFKDKVINYFASEYENARTPNPCVECNRYIKFGRLLEVAQEFGCEKVATGHYVRIEFDDDKQRYLLKKGVDEKKDQSYFLYALQQEQLAKIMFPLGNMRKSEIIAIAKNEGYPVAEEKESQEICFIKGDYRDFLKDLVVYKKGNILNQEKQILGNHQGIPFYTIGQRKGLGISSSKPMYVININKEENEIELGDNEKLFHKDLIASKHNFIFWEDIKDNTILEAKIRYKAPLSKAKIQRKDENSFLIKFEEAQRAVTAGQSIVYYLGDYLVGGGVIEDIVD